MTPPQPNPSESHTPRRCRIGNVVHAVREADAGYVATVCGIRCRAELVDKSVRIDCDGCKRMQDRRAAPPKGRYRDRKPPKSATVILGKKGA